MNTSYCSVSVTNSRSLGTVRVQSLSIWDCATPESSRGSGQHPSDLSGSRLSSSFAARFLSSRSFPYLCVSSLCLYLTLHQHRQFMRFTFPTALRTLYAISNVTTRYLPQQHSAALQPLINKAAAGLSRPSMPIPFLSSLFSSAPSRNMSYPLQKSKDEWQAILSPGKSSCGACGAYAIENLY